MTEPEPTWLNLPAIESILHEQIQEHGGREGTRDENALESALARPQQLFHYGDDRSIEVIAAAYGFGFARAHAFTDGNKRVGFLAMYTFLGLNGIGFDAPESEVVQVFLAVAAGEMAEPKFVDWVKRYTVSSG